ncbi:hypothetical protein SD78_0619 [Bacillus badius]|nr:hypothetical protein SD78_0619 [Bacillus badius]
MENELIAAPPAAAFFCARGRGIYARDSRKYARSDTVYARKAPIYARNYLYRDGA